MKYFYTFLIVFLSQSIFCEGIWVHYEYNQSTGAYSNVRDICYGDGMYIMAMMDGFQILDSNGIEIWNKNNQKLDNTWWYNSSAWTARGIGISDGTVWVATADGIMKLTDENIVRIDTSLKPGLGMDKAYQDVTIDNQGIPWFAGPVNSSISYYKEDKLHHIKVDDWRNGPTLNGTELLIDNSGDKWYRAYKRIVRFDGQSFHQYGYQGEDLGETSFFIDLAIHKDRVYAVIDTLPSDPMSSFLAVLEGGTFKRIEIDTEVLGNQSDQISEIEFDSKGNLYLIPRFTTNGVVYIMDETGNTKQISIQSESKSFFTRSAYVDKLDRLWIGSASNGVYLYSPSGVSSVHSEIRDDILVYPNPAGMSVHIGEEYNGLDYTLFDMKATKIAHGEVSSSNIDIGGLVSGTYLIIISSDGSVVARSRFAKN